MEESTLEANRHQRLAMSARDRLGAWLYTGAPGRLASFSIDLALSLAALGIYGARLAWKGIRGDHSSAA
jgi:hypothetical protein